MARTVRSGLATSKATSHEDKRLRKQWLKRQRLVARRRLRAGRYELVDWDDRKTQGWLTW